MPSPVLKYDTYSFTPVLGWSISRYETFDTCKRRYYYTYYSRHATNVPAYKMARLKSLTSTALEIGTVVHDVLEAFLRRLQKSDSGIDEKRFFEFARQMTAHYCSTKTFLELYYGYRDSLDLQYMRDKIDRCLRNFLNSPCYSWIYMKAISNRENWLIEPPGFGETRIEGMKAYCKMDFLFPVDDEIHILDWKTGEKKLHKHADQLRGYVLAAHNNFSIPFSRIFPKIIYLSPEFEEFEISPDEERFTGFLRKIHEQTNEMYSFCRDVEQNIPAPIEEFRKQPSAPLCRFCNFQELCFSPRQIREMTGAATRRW